MMVFCLFYKYQVGVSCDAQIKIKLIKTWKKLTLIEKEIKYKICRKKWAFLSALY